MDSSLVDAPIHPPADEENWRLTHLGRLLGHALRRFDERVLVLMARNVDVPLALSNLAAARREGVLDDIAPLHRPFAKPRNRMRSPASK